MNIGDWVRVKMRWRKPDRANGISVVSGTIIAEDERTMGFQQYKLDTGWWFSPQSDQVLEHKPHGQERERQGDQDNGRTETGHP